MLRKILRDLKPDAFVSPSDQSNTFVLHTIFLHAFGCPLLFWNQPERCST
jgi:hypothetical protein